MTKLKYKHKDRICLVLKRGKNTITLRDDKGQFNLNNRYVLKENFMK